MNYNRNGNNNLHIVKGGIANKIEINCTSEVKKLDWKDNGIIWGQDGHIYNSTYNRVKGNMINKEVFSDMDNDELYDKKLDSINQHIRDMESRVREDRIESEQRIEEQRKRSEDRIEKRYEESLKNTQNSEERMEKRFNETMDAIKYQSDKVEKKIDNMDTKLGTIYRWIIGLCLTTILAIAALVITKH
ncbi:hypothetical protein [Clostridium sp. JN-1]|uniref:hypothetical protein n=1 Tax=Clostridium sp. JN-1 TaxID=2483110 RepID=UPI000F0BB7B5|nr:hypothetical protein [Clostridium sp. JN-1]